MIMRINLVKNLLVGVFLCNSVSSAIEIDFLSLQKRRENLDSALIGIGEAQSMTVLLREKEKSDSAFAVLAFDLLQYSLRRRYMNALGQRCNGPFSTVIVRGFHVREKSSWDSVAVFRFNSSFEDAINNKGEEDSFVQDYIGFLRGYDRNWEPGQIGTPMVCPSYNGGGDFFKEEFTKGVVRSSERDSLELFFKKCDGENGLADLKKYVYELLSRGRSLYSFGFVFRYAFDRNRFRESLLLDLMSMGDFDRGKKIVLIIRMSDPEFYVQLRKKVLGDLLWNPFLTKVVLGAEDDASRGGALPLDLSGSAFCKEGKALSNAKMNLRKWIPGWSGKFVCNASLINGM